MRRQAACAVSIGQPTYLPVRRVRMAVKFKPTAAFMVALGCIATLSCAGGPLCVPGVDTGTTYTVKILGPYTDQVPGFNAEWVNSQDPPCTGIDGLIAGATFTVWPQNRISSTNCDRVSGTADKVPGVTLGDPSGMSNTANLAGWFMTADQHVTTDTGCAGAWGTVFKAFGTSHSDKAAPFRDPMPGEHPPLLLERWFVPAMAQAAHCSRCSNTFVVKLQH